MSVVCIAGYAAVFDVVDKAQDLILPGAFSRLPEMGSVPILYQHQPHDIIGHLTRLEQTQWGLFCVAHVDLTRAGSYARMMLSRPHSFGLSIGYIDRSSYQKRGIRHLGAMELIEISICWRPLNRLAQAVVVYPLFADRLKPWDPNQLEPVAA